MVSSFTCCILRNASLHERVSFITWAAFFNFAIFTSPVVLFCHSAIKSSTTRAYIQHTQQCTHTHTNKHAHKRIRINTIFSTYACANTCLHTCNARSCTAHLTPACTHSMHAQALRIYKHYDFGSPGFGRLSFSSYPGETFSDGENSLWSTHNFMKSRKKSHKKKKSLG
jgi:hypothetical protein